jgi:predicted metal-dependent peptidase
MKYYQYFQQHVTEGLDLGRDSSGKRWEDYETIKCPDGQIIDMDKLIQEQAKARAALVHLEPMFAAFVNKLNIVYTFHIKTQATDGCHLFVNPQFTANLAFEEKVFVMAHECMHCLLDHLRRGKSAGHEHFKSNIAADYEVNQTLVDLGLFKDSTIKRIGALLNPKYSGWAFERIYNDNPGGQGNQNNNNSKEAQQAEKNQGDPGGQGNKNSNQQHSADYVSGWNKATADYKAGKLKI